jgi:hypothetical protein
VEVRVELPTFSEFFVAETACQQCSANHRVPGHGLEEFAASFQPTFNLNFRDFHFIVSMRRRKVTPAPAVKFALTQSHCSARGIVA